MAKSSIAKRRTTTAAAPRLASVASSEEFARMEFSPSGLSNLSDLLEVARKLPSIAYDAKRGAYVVNVDAAEKAALLDGMHASLLGLTQTLRLMGMLMAGEDKGYQDGDSEDLGFSINGLADLGEQLLRVESTLAAAEPVGAEAEAANG